MPRQRLKITYDDGRVVEAKVTPKVEVAVEKHFNIGLAAIQDDMHAEYLYYMGWAAVHHGGMEGDNFEKFLDKLEDVDLVKFDPEVDDTDFTGKTQSSENSSPLV